ncbi:thioredoxin H2-2-like [Carex rostrata]
MPKCSFLLSQVSVLFFLSTHKPRRKRKVNEIQKMGSFMSSAYATPEESGSESNVIAVHSKDRFDEQFQAHKNSNKALVIDFTATWCGPCRMIGPIFNSLSTKFSQAIFVKVDVDELPEVSREWQVQAMPTFVIVKDGKEVTRIVGAKKDELERKIQMFSS